MSEKPKKTATKPKKKTEETEEKSVKKTKTTAKKTPAETTSKRTAKKTEEKIEKPKAAKKTTAAKVVEGEEKPKAPKKRAPAKAEAEEPKTIKKATGKEEAEVRPKAKKKKAAETAPTKPSKKAKPEKVTKDTIVDSRLMRIARDMKRRQPAFRHEQAHRWVRAPESWRKVRGNDSNMRRMKSGHAPLVSPGYRKPAETRHIHPSGYVEVLVHRPADIDGLDPKLHAIRIGGTVGGRKKQEIIKRAEEIEMKVVNLGAPESAVGEGELFSELEGLEDLEADEK